VYMRNNLFSFHGYLFCFLQLRVKNHEFMKITKPSPSPPFLRVILMSIVLLFTVVTTAQVIKTSDLMSLTPGQIVKYEMSEYASAYLVRIPFASDSITNPGVVRALKDKQIFQIDLVYTDFRKSKGFNQPHLNSDRFKNLYKIAPELFANSAISWNVVSQTGCNSPAGCDDFFHGFVIYYNPIKSGKERVDEMTWFTSSFVEKEYIDTVQAIQRKFKRKYYAPKSNRKLAKGIEYSSSGIWNRKLVRVYDTIPAVRFVKKTRLESLVASGPDTSVLAALNRNTHWDQMQIVIDVTGSMGPYMHQLTQWISLHQNLRRVDDFVFFQDGDNKTDSHKVIGMTKGIYHSEADNVKQVFEKMNYAMRKGFGGDAQENDVEAILYGMNFHPSAKEIVLIADNWANMRDYVLIKKLNKPVHVIVCGNWGSINTQYLDLAYKTKGSIHTMKEDLEELYKLNEGEVLEFEGRRYKISEGRFWPVYDVKL